MRIAICDDEKIFLEHMERLLNGLPEVEQVDSFNDVDKLEQSVVNGSKYDIVFMDIEWKQEKKNGTHYAAMLNRKCPNTQIIYVTAYNDRFAETIFYEPVNLCGYLVKPVKIEKLQLLLKKAMGNIEKQKKEQILVQYRGITESIPHANIIYLESSAHQVFIYTSSDKISVYGKLDDYESVLKYSFVRNHKSFLVNMNYVQRIEGNRLMLQNGTVLPVSKGKYQSTKDKFFRFMGEQL